MAITYDGALGTTVNVFPRGSSVSVGFDSTVVLIGEDEGGEAESELPVFLPDQDEADDAFGEDSGLAAAYAAAAANGADDIYGVAVDEDDWNGAAEAAMSVNPRYVYVDSTEDANVNAVTGVVRSYATDLEFARVFAPTSETISVEDITAYEPRDAHHRLVEVAPQQATVAGQETYTAAAAVGHAAGKPLGSSLAYDTVTVDSLGEEYRPSEATDFEQVTAVTKDATFVDGVTTSDEGAFEDIFQMEIVDTVAMGLDQVAQDYAGSAVNTEDERDNLVSDMRIYLNSLADQNPPLLADAFGGPPFSVQADVGADADAVDVTVGVSPVDVMKQITINLNVGEVITFDGAEA